MKEIRKVWYTDRFFIILMTSLLLCGALVMVQGLTHNISKSVRDYTEYMRISARPVEDDEVLFLLDKAGQTKSMAEKMKLTAQAMEYFYGDEGQTEIFLTEGGEEYYMLLSYFARWALVTVFFLKWMLSELGRKREFQDSLPVGARKRVLAEIMEAVGSILLMTVFVFAYMMAWMGGSHYPESGMLLRGAVILFAYALFHILFFMLLHMVVGKIEILPLVGAVMVLFIPLTEYNGFMDLFPGLYDMQQTWVQLYSAETLFGAEGGMHSGMTVILLILSLLCMAVTWLLAGKKDSSVKRMISYLPVEIIWLFILFLELEGIFLVAFTDWYAGLETFGMGGITAFAFAGGITAVTWYLIDGKYRRMRSKLHKEG